MKNLKKPKEIKLEVTPRCNANCSFCVNRATFAKYGRRDSEEMSTEEVKYIIDKISSSKIKKIRFTGGEPLMRSDIFELMEYAKLKNLFVILNTNGFLVNRKNSDLIKEYSDVILFSLNSYTDKKISESTGVKNALKKKIKAIQLSRSKNTEIWLCSVATRDNIKNMDKLSKLVVYLNPDYFFLLRQIPSPEIPNPTELHDVELLTEKLFRLRKQSGHLYTFGNSIPFCSYEPRKLSRIVSDGPQHIEGCTKLVINPKGRIQIDYAIEKSIGNIFKDDIIKCWNKKFAKDFRELKNVPNICKKCVYIRKCRGGSRYCAKMSNGRYSSIDPLANPKKYKNVLFLNSN